MAGGRQRRVHDQAVWRRVVEKQHHLRQQPVAGAQIDDASSAEQPAHAPSHLPRLVKLLARQTPGATDRPTEAIEQGVARKAAEVVFRQASTRGE